jgi:hypothetical protein
MFFYCLKSIRKINILLFVEGVKSDTHVGSNPTNMGIPL